MWEYISIFISSLITILTAYVFGRITMNKSNSKKTTKVLILIILVIIGFIILSNLNGLLKTLTITILYVIIFKVFFDNSIGKAIFKSLLYTILLIVPDLLSLNIAIYVLKISKDFLYNNLAGGIITNLMVTTVMITLTFLLRKPLRKLMTHDMTTKKRTIIISFMMFITVGSFFYSLIKVFETHDNTYTYIICIVTMIMVLFYLFKQNMDNENMTKRYDDLLNIMKNYESDIKEQRTLIHETKNELMTIQCKIKDKEKSSEIIKYINSIIGDKVSVKSNKFSKFKYLPSNGLRGFFYYKVMEAERRGIITSINVSEQIEKCFLNDLNTKDFKDLVRIIGVFLDNAIEASEKAKDKQIGVEIYLVKGNVKIIISNTFVGSIEESKIGNESYSTKGKNRGHGLLLVKRIINNNNMFIQKSSINKNIYTQELEIKKNSSK